MLPMFKSKIRPSAWLRKRLLQDCSGKEYMPCDFKHFIYLIKWVNEMFETFEGSYHFDPVFTFFKLETIGKNIFRIRIRPIKIKPLVAHQAR